MTGFEFVDDIMMKADICDAEGGRSGPVGHEMRIACQQEPVSYLDSGAWELRLCVEHLKELRTLVLMEYLKRVTIPGAPQRRKDGGLQ